MSTMTYTPMSENQHGLWLLQTMHPDLIAYNVSSVFQVQGKLNVDVLHHALRTVVCRHSMLRTTFILQDEMPTQCIHSVLVPDFVHVDVADICEEALRTQVQAMHDRPFNLETGPLTRLAVFSRAIDDHVVLLNWHHILLDFGAQAIITQEILDVYQAERNTYPLQREVDSEVASHTEFVSWQQDYINSGRGSRSQQYWTEQLHSPLPILDLPSDRPYPTQQTFHGNSQLICLSESLTQRIIILAKQKDVTPFILLLSAYTLLMARYSNQEDIIVGVATDERLRLPKRFQQTIGHMVNLLPMRMMISGNDSLDDLLRQAERVVMGGLYHQNYPFAHMVHDVQTGRDLSRPPIFDVSFNMPVIHTNEAFAQLMAWIPTHHVDPLSIDRLQILPYAIRQLEAQVPLHLDMWQQGSQWVGYFKYNTGLFDEATIARMASHFTVLLEGIVTQPEQPVYQLPMLTEAEYHQIVHEWNDTAVDFGTPQTIHALFEQQVERTTDAVAVIFEDEQLSYIELNQRANQLAHHLIELGVEADTLVAVAMERSMEMVVSLLAVLKAGGAYVPIDPTYPEERIRYMLMDCAAPILLTQSHLSLAQFIENVDEQNSVGQSMHVLAVDRMATKLAAQSTNNPQTQTIAKDLAYVIYTSGSTGQPKGVANQHDGAFNRLQWTQAQFQLTSNDRVLQKTPFSFDVSVWEFFWTLMSGACLVVAHPEGHKDPTYLCHLIQQAQITLLHFVPSMLRQFIADEHIKDYTSLRAILTSGEALPLDLAQETAQIFPGAELHNLYGPTEAAVDVSHWHYIHTSQTVPIGKPIANTVLYVLDAANHISPIGVVGELYIGGVQLAREYLNRPELTAERFIDHPEFGRLYKTGDLCRWLPDGNIEYIGRTDFQVKLRGFRIELGEIENALLALDDVREAVVLAREENGDKRLVAYIVQSGRVAELQSEEGDPAILRQVLAQQLPDYMIPSAFVFLDAMPLTPNGKLDRRALPAPNHANLVTKATFVPPNTSTERLLASIWTEVLGLEKVGITNNFFEIGGDSILSIQIVSRARKAGIHFQIGDIFETKTIAELARIAKTSTLETAIIQADQGLITGTVPLLPIQHWFFENHTVNYHHFNQSVIETVEREIHTAYLVQAIGHMLQHHDALRLCYQWTGSIWQQHYADGSNRSITKHEKCSTSENEEAQSDFCEVDLSHLPINEQQKAMVDYNDTFQKRLNIHTGPLLRVVYFRLKPHQPDKLLWIVHHLTIDWVSWRILLPDFWAVYDQLVEDQPVQMPAKTTSYKQWSEWLQDYAQSETLLKEMDYWLSPPSQTLHPLPVDYPTQAAQATVDSVGVITNTLDVEKTHALLHDVPAVYHTEINDLLLTALALSFADWTGSPTLLVDLEGHGREELDSRLDLTRTVGWFTTIYPVYLSLHQDEQRPNHLGNAIKSIKEQIRNIPQKGIGYGILRYTSPETHPALAALPQAEVSFNYGGQFRDIQMDSWGGEWAEKETLGYRFTVMGLIVNEQLTFSLLYSKALYQHETVQRLADTVLAMLERLIAHCQSEEAGGYTPSDFPDIDIAEQDKLDTLFATIQVSQNQIEAIYPLSPSQEGMLLDTLSSSSVEASEHSTSTSKYIESFIYAIESPLDYTRFQKAWEMVVRRHPILRSGFVWEGHTEPLQFVVKAVSSPITYYDWRSLSPAQQQHELKACLDDHTTTGFDLAKPPLFQIVLCRLDDDEYRLVWKIHHILTDGWSNPIILHDLRTYYEAYLENQPLQLVMAPPYQKYIRWLKKQDIGQAQQFWQKTLRGFTQATPLGKIEETLSSAGQEKRNLGTQAEEFGTLSGCISLDTTKHLQKLVQQQSLTLNTLMRGVWASLLSRYSGQSDIVFGATIAGRAEEVVDVEAIVGPFINTIPIRVQIETNRSFLACLPSLQSEALQLDNYGYCSSGQIHSWSDVPGSQPLFESILVFQNMPSHQNNQRTASSITFNRVDWSGAQTPYALTMMIIFEPALRLEVIFDTQRFNPSDIQQIIAHFQFMLDAIAANPNQPIQTYLAQIPEEQVPRFKSVVQIQSLQEYTPPQTEQEKKLVEIWENLLGVSPVGIHDNFFELGGHSLLATQLTTKIREAFFVDLSLSTLFSTPTIAACTDAIRQQQKKHMVAQVGQGFPALMSCPEHRYDPFPLTDVQHAYWTGRNAGFELGNVAAYIYFEIDASELDIKRLNQAWSSMIERHEMLRAIFQPDGQQRILETVPDYTFAVTDLTTMKPIAQQQTLMVIRDELSHQLLPTDQWPLFDIRITRLGSTDVRLHIGIDILIVDATSLDILLREWIMCYQNPQMNFVPLNISFRDYVFAEKTFIQSDYHQQIWAYWENRLEMLPPAPELPVRQDAQTVVQPRFQPYTFHLDMADWTQLKRYGRQANLTDSAIVLSVFAEILAQWSKQAHFTLNLTLFNRLPLHPQINEILGDFTPLLMLEVDNRKQDESFRTRAQRLQQQLWNDLDHRAVNGVRVLRELAKRQNRTANQALMPIVFTSLLGSGFDNTLFEPMGEMTYMNAQTPQVWLDHAVVESGGSLDITWSVVEELFPEGLIAEMFEAYCTLLQRLATDEAAWHTSNLVTLPPQQQQQRIAVNDTDAPICEEMLHTLFLKQVDAHATEAAIITPTMALTYEELYHRANQVGHWLRAEGEKPNMLVGVMMEKGWEQVVAVLGIHLAGAAYLPIDPTLPTERQHYLLSQGEATIALTQSHLDASLTWPQDITRLQIDTLTPDTTLPRLETVQTPTDLAYVIYTSGSTGQPKGVVIDHRGAVNTVLDVNQRYGITSQDRVLALSALNFDLSVYDIFGLLAAGGTIVMPDPERRVDPEHWQELIDTHDVTVWNTVPALMQMLVEYEEGRDEGMTRWQDDKMNGNHPFIPSSLHLVMLSGDWVPVTLPDRIRALHPDVRIYSMGGATEASIWSIYYPIEAVDPAWPSIPYGKPMTNQTFHVLDANLNPRPTWVPGDLYIGGIGLALGYWKDEERTNASFITHPCTGERLYKTGDLGRYLPAPKDGFPDIEFLGREDFQVKIRGYRIELGEIESALLQYNGVSEAVVNAVGDPKGHQQLVGYVVLDDRHAGLQPDAGKDAYATNNTLPDVYDDHQSVTLTDPVDRLEFKLRQPGIRDVGHTDAIALPTQAFDETRRHQWLSRQSHRQFLDEMIDVHDFSEFLSCLMQMPMDGKPLPKYRYPSAGNLYPVQCYLYIKPERIAGLAGGYYYYRPTDHQLIPLQVDAPAMQFAAMNANQAIFDQSAFTLFLVADLEAIAPMYGAIARDFSLLEAGYISQLLMMEAPQHALGLCPIGGIDQATIQTALALGTQHELVHSLAGGRIDPQQSLTIDKSSVNTKTAQQSDGISWQRQLQDYLTEKLPAYMVPTAFVALPSLPLTANGKVDRKALPMPDLSAISTGESTPPSTETEQLLASLWSEMLGVEQVGIHDDFFVLGGDSLIVTQLRTRLRTSTQIDLPLRTFFDKSTIVELAKTIEATLAVQTMTHEQINIDDEEKTW